MTEQDLQKRIKLWLESKGAHVTKYNANGYGIAGHPDLFVSFPADSHPFAFFVEVKKEKGVLSNIQILKFRKMLDDGHAVITARSVADVENYLTEIGML